MNIYIIITIILGILCFSGFLFLIFFMIMNRKVITHYKQIEMNNKKKAEFVDQQMLTNQNKEEELNSKIKEYEDKILNFNSLDLEATKQELFQLIRNQEQDKIKYIILEAKTQARETASQILLECMQHVVYPLLQTSTTVSMKIDDSVKGKVIGRDGRNKKIFETLTGTDLIVDKESNFLTISSHNPIRRELASKLMSEMLSTKVIEPNKVEITYEDIKSKFEQELFNIGKWAIEEILQIYDLPQELYSHIGKLKFRSSYGQNILEHTIETAKFANQLAKILQLDIRLATQCGLLHDIGKSCDYDINKNHVDAGLDLVNGLNLDSRIVNAIASHHGQTIVNNIYSEVVQIADTLSAARPGARMNTSDEYFERVQTLENIVVNLPYVQSAYVIKAGRQLRIMINPTKVQDKDLENIALDVRKSLEDNELIKNYKIKVVIIKENRIEFETESKR